VVLESSPVALRMFIRRSSTPRDFRIELSLSKATISRVL
jgi:hypothetical protein